jgi:hypothetical protein
MVGYVRLKQNWPEADGYGNECWSVNLLGCFGPFGNQVINLVIHNLPVGYLLFDTWLNTQPAGIKNLKI